MNVLVVFYSRDGETEHLALTIGVGAIQARANIRLRRLPPRSDTQLAALTRAQRENFERMARDYVAPRPADPLWADAVIVAQSRHGGNDLEEYIEGLPKLGAMAGKIGASVALGQPSELLRPIYAAVAE